jgi:hypothetical protein
MQPFRLRDGDTPMLNTLSPIEIELAQERLVAPPLDIDLVDLLHELERSPDDPELRDLADHFAYYSEI